MGYESASWPLVVVAHPDDETIGMGGQLPRLAGVSIVHVTDGAPRRIPAPGFATWQEYAAARRVELANALALAGIGPGQLHCLGVPDQDASREIAAFTPGLAEIISQKNPDVIFTHPYEGGHPDHDATAFAVRLACRLVGSQARLVEFASYNAATGVLMTGEFLPDDGHRPLAIRLTAPDRARKRRMLDCFVTQQDFLRHFRVDVERLRPAPDYDFSRPPHDGRLFYERCGWGSSEEWRRLAREALEELCLSPS